MSSKFIFKLFEFFKKDYLFFVSSIFFLFFIVCSFVKSPLFFIYFTGFSTALSLYFLFSNFKKNIIVEYSLIRVFGPTILYLIVFPIAYPLVFVAFYFILSINIDFSLVYSSLVFYSFIILFSLFVFFEFAEILNKSKSALLGLEKQVEDIFSLTYELPDIIYLKKYIHNELKNEIKKGDVVFSLNSTKWNNKEIDYKTLIKYLNSENKSFESLNEDDISLINMMSI